MTSTNFSQNRGDSARELASKALLEQTEMELDKFGAIQEIADDAVRLATIAEKQIEALQAWRASLIIATTQGEYRAIADAVRQAMKEKGLLSDTEHSVTRLKRLNLTESPKKLDQFNLTT
jgi:hypothetical protein